MSPRARPLLSLERTLGDLAWRLPSSRARLEAAADDRHVWVLYDQRGEDAVSLWDVDTGCEVEGTSFATRRVSSAAVSRDGRTLALAHDDGVTVWDAYAGATIRTFEGLREPCLALDERGAQLLVWGGRDDPNERGASLYNVRTGEQRRVNMPLAPATLSLDATTLVASDRPAQVRSWDITNEEPRALCAVQVRGWVSRYAPVSDGDVFVGTSEGEVRRWSPRDGVTRWVRADLRGRVWCLRATPDGRRVALTCILGVCEGTVLVLDGRTGENLLCRSCSSPHALVLAPGGLWLAMVERDVLSVVEVPGGARRERVSGHAGPVTAVAFAPDRSVLASGASDGVRVWDLMTGDTRLMLETALEVESLAFMPDGRALVALTTSTMGPFEPSEAVAWDLATGSERSRVPTPGKRTPLAVSPDARYALWATTSDASDAARRTPTLHVWDLARSRPLQVTGLPGRDGVAVGVDLTPDGREATVLCEHMWWRVELGTLRRVAEGPITYRGRLLDLGVGLWRLGQLIAVASGLLAPPEPEPEEPMFGSFAVVIPSSGGRHRVVARSVDALRQVFSLADVGPYEPHGRVDLGASHNLPTSMAFSSDASHIAVGTARGVLRVFRTARG